MITSEQVYRALSHVDDPDLKKDLVSLGMIRNLEIKGGRVSFTVMLTTPACPMKDMLENACRNAVRLMVPGVEEITITMSSETRHTRQDATILPGVKNIIAIASGKGGVGKSTVAANLAIALAESGAAVGLLDADIYGPSVPTLFGVHEAPEMRAVGERNLMVPHIRRGVKLLSIGFMAAPDQPIVWRGPMVSSAIRQLVQDADWGNLDYLIVDLPPGTGDVQLTLVQQVPLTGVLVVCTPQELAIADARRAVAMFKVPGIEKPVLGIVENMAWFQPEAEGAQYYLFGKGGGARLAEEFGLPLLMQIPMEVPPEKDAKSINLDTDTPVFAVYRNLAGEMARAISMLNAGNLDNFAAAQ
jgi:ATP-binding protein involved in chromosome partitioning